MGYRDILEETLLCFRLPAYEAKLCVRERKLSKWYWCDPGMVRAMKHTSGSVTSEVRGALFEGLVAQLLRAYKDYRDVYELLGTHWLVGYSGRFSPPAGHNLWSLSRSNQARPFYRSLVSRTACGCPADRVAAADYRLLS